MKIWGIQIETKNMPWFAWLIISIGIMLVCIGVMISLIRYGSVEFKAQEQRLMEQNERMIHEEFPNEDSYFN